MEKNLQKWRFLAPLGLLCTGAGLSFMGDAANLKGAGAEFWDWFLYGTFSLVVFNAGLVLLVESAKCRLLYEIEKQSNSKE